MGIISIIAIIIAFIIRFYGIIETESKNRLKVPIWEILVYVVTLVFVLLSMNTESYSWSRFISVVISILFMCFIGTIFGAICEEGEGKIEFKLINFLKKEI